jgi:hypothetical protein
MDPQEQEQERQRLLLLAVWRVLEAAGRTVGRSQQALELMALQVKGLVQGLPAEGLLRDRAWQQLKPQVQQVLNRAALAVGRDLVLEAAVVADEQARWARRYLQASGVAVSRLPALPVIGIDPAQIERLGASPELLLGAQQQLPVDVKALVQRMRIDGKTLQQWFGSSVVERDAAGRFVTGPGVGGVAVDGGGQPLFARFGLRSIERQVKAGFLQGWSSERIAQELIADEIRGGMRLGQSVVRLKSDARAIARTGLAHIADLVRQEQWQAAAAAGALPGVMWRWDATFDARTCPGCSALDGRTVGERSGLPGIPLHIQCRCAVVPVTREQQEQERAAGARRTAVELTAEPPPAQRAGEARKAYLERLNAAGWYAAKVKAPSGEWLWRRRVQVPQQRGAEGFGQFLGALVDRRKVDPIGAATTLQEYFGGGRAGARRMVVFSQLVNGGQRPEDALQEMFRATGRSALRRWVPVEQLRERYPQWAEAIDAVQPVRSVRQQRQIDAGKPMGRPRRGY